MIETQAPTVDSLSGFPVSQTTDRFWFREIALQLAQMNETLAAILFAGIAPSFDIPEADEVLEEATTNQVKLKRKPVHQ